MKKILLFAVFLVGFLNETFAQQVSVDIQDPLPVCNSGDCVDLNATFTPVETTTNYRIESIPFEPAGLTGGIILDATSDDVWSPYFNLPFRFCFYGQYYDRVLIGSNGLITFDTTNFSPGPGCPWNLQGSSPIPTTNIPVRNAIYGVYQDTNIAAPPVTNPAVQNVNYYITGTAPNRKFVVNYNELPLFGSCSGSGLQTSQIVLYETSNIIDINIVRRQRCTAWNSALGVVGILNASGSQGMAPPGRNLGVWDAGTESWRFIPDGNVNTAQITWLENGNPIPGSTGQTTITVCPTVDTDYTAVVSYTQCDTTIRTVSDTITVGPEPFVLFNEPEDIVICATGSGPYSFDLDQDDFMLNLADPPNAQDPNDFFITYHTSYADAVAGFPFIQPGTNPGELSNYLSNGGETIWVAVQDFWTNGCIQYRSFDLVVQADPSGDIGYTGSPYCTSDTNTYLPSTNTVAPLTGNFVVTPSTGLSIDTTTGEITPSTSAIGTYSVVYHIDATSTCPAYDTPPVEIIIQDCSSCSLALDTNFGPASQTICLGNSIADIVYNYGGDANNFDLQFTPNLPAGLSVNIVGSQLTITGTPTETGTFNYGISTLGCISNIGPLTGSIIINNMPAVPLINTIAATCTSDGVSTITNYTSGLTYVFTPSGPSVDATGLISGMTPGTSYTVVADNGSCSSSSSVSFTNDAMLTTPAVPTVSSVAADCSSDEISSISNYDGSVTYIFTPSGPSVDATGLISGMVVGTSYTVYADNGSCSSVASSSFTNDAMLATPAVPTINTIAATCTSDGVSTITNYTSGLTYVFTPSGPSVDATGLISGMTPGTSYTVVADNGSCSSSSSVSFTNDAMLTTPAVPTVSSVAADCSSDEISSISNYDGSVTYIFTPSGPSVDATGLISGMVVGTSYTVYADNGSCSSVASSSFTNDAMLATPAVPTINTIAATCTSDGVSTITNYTSGLTYVFTPSGPSVDATGLISGMTPGTSYTVVADNGSCSSSSSVSFTNDAMLTTPAVPTVSSVAADCSSDEISSISNYDGSVTYIFTPSGPSVDATGLISGMVVGTSYTVYADNGSCSSVASSSFTNDAMLATPAVPTINTIAATCTSDGVSTITNYTSGLTYVFTPSGPSVDATGLISGMTPGTSYTVVADNGSCSSSSSVSFTNDAMLTLPVVPIINTITESCSSDGISTVTNFVSGLTYIFTPVGPSVQSNGEITNMIYGVTYTVYADNGSCSSSNSSSFMINQMLPTPSIVVTNNSPSICDGDMTNIVVTGLQTGETLNWIVNANEVNGLISGQGTSFTDAILTLFSGIETPRVVNIRFYADNGSCTSSFHDIDVTVNPRPDIMVSPNTPEEQTICSGETTNIEISSTYPNVTFSWEVISNVNGVVGASNGTGDTIAQTLSVSGTLQGVVVYRLHAFIGSCESANTIDFTVYVNPKPVYNPIITPTAICDGASINLNYSHPDTNITFGWDLVLTNADVVGGILSGVTTTNSLNLNQAFTLVDSLVSGQATFTVWVDLNGCKSDPFTATVDIHPNPQVQLQDGAICVQDGQVYQTYWLNAGVLPLGGDYEYEWFMVDTAGDISLGTTTTPYYEVVMAGDYYVVVTNVDVLLGTNCSGVSNTVTVIETNPATLANATVVVTEFFTGSGVVTITVTDGNGTLEYQLDEGEFQSSNVFTGVSAGPHTVTVVDTQGCTYFTIPVLVVDYPKFFTPNGDGYNDTWNIIGLEQENAKLYIFDRYGKLIKQINTLGANQGNGWDGTLNGKPLPSTDYWFSLEYEENGIMKEFKAHFSLKR